MLYFPRDNLCCKGVVRQHLINILSVRTGVSYSLAKTINFD